MQKPDDYLIHQFLSGDRNAFTLLVNRHKQDIFIYILNKVQNQETASDLTQDVFVRVFKAVGQYSAGGKFKAWLFRIAQNVCIDEHRQRRKASILSLNERLNTENTETPILSDQLADSSANPYKQVESEEIKALINQAINSIPEKQRTALVLCQYQGLSYQQIAAIQKCPLGTVKSRINTALTKVKDFLRENEVI